MSTFKKYKPSSEKELHGIIQKELDEIEEGLVCLKYEFTTGKGIPDFLCVDSGGKLVIIEVKLNEDENVLFQALRYYSIIEKDRYIISNTFSENDIDPEQNPRIIIIAERFSEDIRHLSTLVKPEVELLEYTTLTGREGEKGIFYHTVTLPSIDPPPSKPLSIDDHREYLQKETLKIIFDKLRDGIKNIGNEIDEYPTQGYVGYKFKGRQFAYIRPRRKSIELGAHIIDDDKQLLDYDGYIVETDIDDYGEHFKKIESSFVNLGGRITE